MNNPSEKQLAKLVTEIYKSTLQTCVNNGFYQLSDAIKGTICALTAMMHELKLDQKTVDNACDQIKATYKENQELNNG